MGHPYRLSDFGRDIGPPNWAIEWDYRRIDDLASNIRGRVEDAELERYIGAWWRSIPVSSRVVDFISSSSNRFQI